jgi:hypothetical protein
VTRRPEPAGRARSLGFVALVGCAAPALPAEPAAPLRPLAPAAELDHGFRAVVVAGQGLELLLPDADGWRRDRHEPRSWVATHAATHSRLVVRAWRAQAIAPVAACERQMRLWRPDLPVLPAEARLETRELRLPDDTRAELWSGVSEPDPASGTLTGYAQLVASDGRQCWYLGYTTSANGRDRARIIGARLGTMTRVAFERLRRRDIGARVSAPSL